jgi:ribosomal protein S18 acetylase RimI-like enzyme
MVAAHDLSEDPAGNRGLNPDLDRKLLSRAEDAGLNASAPPQQLWIDGWLVRFSPGKAKRARCVNALAGGRLSLLHKLARAEAVFAAAQLPMVVRITPFTRPAGLDAELAARGFDAIDDTRVMVAPTLTHLRAPALPPGLKWSTLGASALAQAVGALRGSPLAQRQAHAERLANASVPFRALAIQRRDDGAVVACGQSASEGDLVGIYDVFVLEALRGQGLARALCTKLLDDARRDSARSAYLQVEADNHAARAVYFKLGFADGYAYHYRTRTLGRPSSQTAP